MSAPEKGGAPAPSRLRAPAGVAQQGHPFFDEVRSEWLKLRTVRSSWITLLVTFAATVGLGALICSIYRYQFDRGRLSLSQLASFDSAFTTVSGVELAQFAIGVIGVVLMTSEYATGTIRASLAAVPRRVRLLTSKALVLAAVSLAVGLAGCFGAFFAGEPILGLPSLRTTLGAPGVLRVVLGGAAYLTLIGLLGLGIGTLLRRTAGAVAAVFGLLLVLPIIVSLLPSPWNVDIHEYLPDQAGASLIRLTVRTGLLAPGWGALLLCGYAAAALVAGGILLVRRDA